MGVLFMKEDANPIGYRSRVSALRKVEAPPRILRPARETMPVCTTPAAIINIAATVTTAGLERPLSSPLLGAMPKSPAAESVVAKTSTGGIFPLASAIETPSDQRTCEQHELHALL